MRNEEDEDTAEEGKPGGTVSESRGPHLTPLWCQADLLIVP